MKLLCLSHVFPMTPKDFHAPFLLSWANQLMEHGFNITFIVPHTSNLKMEENWNGLNLIRFKYASPKKETLCYTGEMHNVVLKSFLGPFLFIKFLYYAYKETLFQWNNNNFDRLIVHWGIPMGFVALALKLIHNIPYDIISHGTDIRLVTKKKILTLLLQPIWKQADNTYCVSLFLADKLKQPCQILPMPIKSPLTIFPHKSYSNKTINILYAGRFTNQKQIHIIAEALQILTASNWQLTLIGDGIDKQKILKHFIPIKNKTTILATVSPENLSKYYNEADIFILPSKDEGFGLTIVEAMAYGCFVIGYNSGALPEIISKEANGRLFSSMTELSEIIQNFIDKPPINKNLSYFESNYHPNIIGKKWSDAFNSQHQT